MSPFYSYVVDAVASPHSFPWSQYILSPAAESIAAKDENNISLQRIALG